jgi:hypothetical protein
VNEKDILHVNIIILNNFVVDLSCINIDDEYMATSQSCVASGRSLGPACQSPGPATDVVRSSCVATAQPPVVQSRGDRRQ